MKTEIAVSSTLHSQHLAAALDALMRHSFHSVMVSEAQSNSPVVYVNDAFTDLTGYSAEETIGKSPSFLQGPETDRTVLDRLHEDMSAGRVFEGKTTNYRKNGSAFTMHWRVVPVKDASGHPVYFAAFQQESRSE